MTTTPKSLAAERNPQIAEEEVLREIPRLLKKYEVQGGGMIAILEEIQALAGYLPEKALRKVSVGTGIPLAEVFAVATFYSTFSLNPRGKHLICACLGTACHVRGASRIVEEFQNQLGIKAGETTQDMKFTLETVNCLGACALGPVVVIDGQYHSKVKKSQVRQLIEDASAGKTTMSVTEDKRIFPIQVSCPRCNHVLMDDSIMMNGYPSIRVTAAWDGKQDCLHFSSLYGVRKAQAQCTFPQDKVARIYCPYCHEQLIDEWECPECEAPMASMIVRGGGMLRVCSRTGCRNCMFDLI